MNVPVCYQIIVNKVCSGQVNGRALCTFYSLLLIYCYSRRFSLRLSPSARVLLKQEHNGMFSYQVKLKGPRNTAERRGGGAKEDPRRNELLGSKVNVLVV